MSEPVVTHAPEALRYEVHVDDAIAGFAEYRIEAGATVFTHTEVDDAFEGQGIGSSLARGALEQVAAAGGRVVPLCAFIARYVERHPEHAALVDADLAERLR